MDYIGIDISKEICQINKQARPHWTFLATPAEVTVGDIQRENVFCFSLVFHILHPDNMKKIFQNLCRYASRRIFVYTWINDPHLEVEEGEEYQMYHPMGHYLPLFNKRGFDLHSVECLDTRKGISSGLYIFKRRLAPCSL